VQHDWLWLAGWLHFPAVNICLLYQEVLQVSQACSITGMPLPCVISVCSLQNTRAHPQSLGLFLGPVYSQFAASAAAEGAA